MTTQIDNPTQPVALFFGGRGRIGKSTLVKALISLFPEMGFEDWEAVDLDDENKSLIRAYPEKTTAIQITEDKSKLIQVLRRADASPSRVVLYDTKAHDLNHVIEQYTKLDGLKRRPVIFLFPEHSADTVDGIAETVGFAEGLATFVLVQSKFATPDLDFIKVLPVWESLQDAPLIAVPRFMDFISKGLAAVEASIPEDEGVRFEDLLAQDGHWQHDRDRRTFFEQSLRQIWAQFQEHAAIILPSDVAEKLKALKGIQPVVPVVKQGRRGAVNIDALKNL